MFVIAANPRFTHGCHSTLDFAIDPSPMGRDVASALYRVSGIPTQYVIDKNGEIVTSIVGYACPSPDLEKAVVVATATR